MMNSIIPKHKPQNANAVHTPKYFQYRELDLDTDTNLPVRRIKWNLGDFMNFID